MINYRGSMNVNIFPDSEYRLIIIATVRLYTKESKNPNNVGLHCKHFYSDNISNTLFSILVEYNYNGATDQTIRKIILNLVYYNAVIMPIKHVSYLISVLFVFYPIFYFIYRFIMSDNFQLSYFPILITLEPMDIEGEVACAVCPT